MIKVFLRRMLPFYLTINAPLIYDIGCGEGCFLNKYNGMVVGIDTDKNKLDIARKLYPYLEFLNIDALDVDYSTADAVVMCDTFHHLPYQVRLLTRLYRQMKRGAMLYIQDISKESLMWYIGKLFDRKVATNYLTANDLFNMVEGVGFKILKKNTRFGIIIIEGIKC